jgi:hypothetical protein
LVQPKRFDIQLLLPDAKPPKGEMVDILPDQKLIAKRQKIADMISISTALTCFKS